MHHIKTYFDMVIKILRQESDGDIMYYLDTINSPEEAMEVINTLRDRLTEMSKTELTREMNRQTYHTKEDLLASFEHIIEKQRGYPLGMGEYSDLEERAQDWAEDNGYSHMFKDYDR